jgi:hypothetical protein
MKFITVLLTLFSTSTFAQNSQNAGCQRDTPCELDSGRSYHVKVPADWDGKARLTVLMHFFMAGCVLVLCRLSMTGFRAQHVVVACCWLRRMTIVRYGISGIVKLMIFRLGRRL